MIEIKIKDEREIDFHIDEYLFSVEGEIPHYSTKMEDTLTIVKWIEENGTKDQRDNFYLVMSVAAGMYWYSELFPQVICYQALATMAQVKLIKEVDNEEAEASKPDIPKVTRTPE